MFIPQAAFYIHKSDKDSFLGTAQTDHFFCAIYIENGCSKEKGDDFIEQLKDEVQHVSLSQLVKFETWLQDVINQANLPAEFSLAAGVVYEDILYLKTTKDGQIYLRREDQFVKLIDGNKSASGHVKVDDFLIFTTKSFSDNFPENDELKKLIDKKSPDEIAPLIETYETDVDENDCVGLFIQFKEKKKINHSRHRSIHSPIIVDDPSLLDPPQDSISKRSLSGEDVIEKTYTPGTGTLFTDTLVGENNSKGIDNHNFSDNKKEGNIDQTIEEIVKETDNDIEETSQKSSLTDKLEESEIDNGQKTWQKSYLKKTFFYNADRHKKKDK